MKKRDRLTREEALRLEGKGLFTRLGRSPVGWQRIGKIGRVIPIRVWTYDPSIGSYTRPFRATCSRQEWREAVAQLRDAKSLGWIK